MGSKSQDLGVEAVNVYYFVFVLSYANKKNNKPGPKLNEPPENKNQETLVGIGGPVQCSYAAPIQTSIEPVYSSNQLTRIKKTNLSRQVLGRSVYESRAKGHHGIGNWVLSLFKVSGSGSEYCFCFNAYCVLCFNLQM